MRPLAVLVPFLALVLVAPTTLADHSYSHRYVVYGKLLDADGAPVANETLTARLLGLDAEGPCADQPNTQTQAFGPTRTRATTDENGEFIFCFHVHRIARGQDVRIMLQASQALAVEPIDPELRAQLIVLRGNMTGGSGVPSEHIVVGRLWTEANGTVTEDGIAVYGHTMVRKPVNVTLAGQRFDTRTNNYGDFAIRYELGGALEPGTEILVETANHTWKADANTTAGITWIRGAVPSAPPTATPPTGSTPPPPAVSTIPTHEMPNTPPGVPAEEVPAIPLPAWLSIAAIAIALARRRR